MKQIAQYQDGRIELQEVPRPSAPPGGVLVRTSHSVISIGTEKMKVEQARMNLLQKARARPDQVRKVLDTARTLGWKSALDKVRNRLETPTPLGYSAAGRVEEVHRGNTRFRVGDRVACGGAECAFHAEYIAVPDMLAAPVPEPVENWQAAYTTLCSIALQAVRQTNASLGDKVLVMGQGLVGLLVTSILALQGARVLAVDVAEARRPFSQAMGAERVVVTGPQELSEEVRAWTEGYGVDRVVMCTGTSSNTPIEQAAAALRDRGLLVVVGNTKTDLDWKVFYAKELEVRYSRSYGPGRYDPSYEWAGSDYPIGHVRWTEQRNFQACLHLMATGQLNLEAITTRRVPFGQVLEVYQGLLQGQAGDIGVVIEYAQEPGAHASVILSEVKPEPRPARSSSHAAAARLQSPVPHLDVIGAGNFARTMLLPHVQGRLALGTVVNNTSLSAHHVKTKFGFQKAATEPQELWAPSQGAGAVLIATRHHLHAGLVRSALEAGRHVFVEKPLCLTREELAAIDAAVAASAGSVMVGFNRRFAPAAVELKQLLKHCVGPKSASYRVAAGALDPNHWYANETESGGRVLGEACHFLDFFCFLFEAKPVRVMAQPVWPVAGRLAFPDSVTAQVEFGDGSCAQLIYTAEGDPAWPKETLTVFASGLVAEMSNFQKLDVYRGRKSTRSAHRSKGHAEEMAAWVAYVRAEAEHPLPYAQARASMLLTFAVLESIRQGCSVEVC